MLCTGLLGVLPGGDDGWAIRQAPGLKMGRHLLLHLPPQLGQAVGYALSNWEALMRYTEQSYLAIDNNLAERTLRQVTLGRNNWQFCGSAAGGQTAAALYSVIGTCKHLGIDPFAFLREALPGLFALGEKPAVELLLEWLPDCWLLRRARESPPASAGAG
jgi:hypothetical protein